METKSSQGPWVAITQVAAVVFSMTALEANQAPALTAEAQREFVRLAGLALLRLGTAGDRDQPKNRDAVFVLLDMVGMVGGPK